MKRNRLNLSPLLTNKNCYNDVITFNDDKWRSGHAVTNKYGDLIVEFSLNPGESFKRLFYGLNKYGRYYFPGEKALKQIITIQSIVDKCALPPDAKHTLRHIADDDLVFLIKDDENNSFLKNKVTSLVDVSENVDDIEIKKYEGSLN